MVAAMSTKRTVSYVAVFVCFVATGWWLVSYATHRGDRRFPLAIASSDLDFGQAWAGDDFRWGVGIRNTTRRTVNVLALRTDCRCARVEPGQLTLRGGESRDVELKIDLTAIPPEAASQATFPFTLGMMAALEGERPLRQKWELEGIVRQAVAISPREIDFFGDLVEGRDFPSRSARLHCFEPDTTLEVQCDPALLRARALPLDDAGREFRLEVMPAKGLPVGPFQGTVLVRACRDEGGELPAAKLRVSGEVMSDVCAVPEAILLGPIATGRTVTRRAAIRCRSGGALRIERVETQTKAVDVRMGAAPNQPIHEILLTVSVRERGAQRATVSVEVRREGTNSSNAVLIPVSWYGVEEGADKS
jgi:hypothetical protein